MFLDRDASHFKIILNYLRYDLDINPAMLPKERKYLLELKKTRIVREYDYSPTAALFMQ